MVAFRRIAGKENLFLPWKVCGTIVFYAAISAYYISETVFPRAAPVAAFCRRGCGPQTFVVVGNAMAQLTRADAQVNRPVIKLLTPPPLFLSTDSPRRTFNIRPQAPQTCNTTRKKNGFVTATKLGTTNEFFVASTKNFAAATKRFVDRTKYFVVTKHFCYPYFLTNDFVGITKPFFPCIVLGSNSGLFWGNSNIVS